MRNKQTNILRTMLLFGVLMLFAVPAVLAAPAAPSIYLTEDINVDCGASATVEVRISTIAAVTGVQTDIYFDPACVNITDVDFTGSPWQPMVQPGWSHWGDHVRLGAMTYPGVAAGDYLFATITVECVGCDCVSDIGFTEVRPDGTTAYNGTVTCGTPGVPSIYLTEDINVDCGTSATAEVRLSTIAAVTGVQTDIYFDPACVNITDVDYTGAPWQPTVQPGWSHWGDHVRLGAMAYPGVAAGDYLFATITVECVGCDCVSDIGFTEVRPDGTTAYNGTVTCVPPPPTDCLGDCYNATGGLVASNVPCYECIGVGTGVSWENYPCPAGTGGCTCPAMLHEICPECCDGIDNDVNGATDWPADDKCGCCIDPDERDGTDPCPPPCVPELPTLALAGIGILGIALLARKRE